MTQKFLADVNFWLALAMPVHTSHASALYWFSSQANDSVCFCRMAQQGFLRLLTDVRVFKDEAITLPESWNVFDTLNGDPRVCFLQAEPIGLEMRWRNYTQRPSFSPKIWNDAYLAAFATSQGIDIVTFDKGFAQFDQLACTILS